MLERVWVLLDDSLSCTNFCAVVCAGGPHYSYNHVAFGWQVVTPPTRGCKVWLRKPYYSNYFRKNCKCASSARKSVQTFTWDEYSGQASENQQSIIVQCCMLKTLSLDPLCGTSSVGQQIQNLCESMTKFGSVSPMAPRFTAEGYNSGIV